MSALHLVEAPALDAADPDSRAPLNVTSRLHDSLRHCVDDVLATTAELRARRAVRASPQTRRLVEQLQREAQRARELLAGVRSYLSAGEPAFAIVAPGELLDMVAEELLLPPAIGLSVEVEPGLPSLRADPDQLADVLRALIRNALAAMGEAPGALRLVARRSPAGTGVELQVADSGCGIPPDDLPHVFDPDHSFSRPGVGLGLPFAHYVVAAHDGRLFVESELGVGTTVRLTLPTQA